MAGRKTRLANGLTKGMNAVHELVIHGMMNKDISNELGISINAVKINLTQIYNVFGSQNRAHHIANYWKSKLEELRNKYDPPRSS